MTTQSANLLAIDEEQIEGLDPVEAEQYTTLAWHNPAVRAEFRSYEHCLAYVKAVARGSVRRFGR